MITNKILNKKELANYKLVIDIDGEDGNAFVLFGYATHVAEKLLWPQTKIDAIIKEMQSDDYYYLLQVFDKYFGDFVVLYTTNKIIMRQTYSGIYNKNI